MQKHFFSFNEYLKILKTYKKRFVKFHEAEKESFVILRHDVEYSVNRALKIAELESQNSVSSTFFFKVSSNVYNIFSRISIDKINKIKELGHDIGLHFYVSHIKNKNLDKLKSELKIQKDIFEGGLNIKCKSFSFHRPPIWVLKIRKDFIGGLLNTYGPSYFEFSKKPNNIKYISDSQHKWNFGHPLDFTNNQRIQLLLHPDEWSRYGDRNYEEFFYKLINENNNEFLIYLENETKHFKLYKKKLK